MISIHIGTHKTGSTSIQNFMAAHEKVLAKHGVLYPNLGRNRSGGHFGLKSELRGRDSGGLPNWTALRELADRMPQAHIVVSCEGFEFTSPRDIAAIAELLKAHPVTVIGYFREYGGLVQSQYLQLTRICRNVDDFDPFFDRYLHENDRTYTRFARWADVFGWEQMRVRLFDRAALAEGDAVADFLGVLGWSRKTLGIHAEAERNVAPSWQAVEMMRAVFAEIGKAGSDDESLLQKMRREVRDACEGAMASSATPPAAASYLSAAQRERCNALTQQDLADFNRHLPTPGLPLPKLAVPAERAFLPSIAQLAPADVIAAMAVVTRALLGADEEQRLEERRKKKAVHAEKRRNAEEVAQASGIGSAQPPKLKKKQRDAATDGATPVPVVGNRISKEEKRAAKNKKVARSMSGTAAARI